FLAGQHLFQQDLALRGLLFDGLWGQAWPSSSGRCRPSRNSPAGTISTATTRPRTVPAPACKPPWRGPGNSASSAQQAEVLHELGDLVAEADDADGADRQVLGLGLGELHEVAVVDPVGLCAG